MKKSLSVIVFISLYICSFAQLTSGSFGSTYVPSDGFISIFGDHSFDYADCGLYPGLILTARDQPGFVNFVSGSSWSGATEESHVDGFVRTFSTDPFVFPVGNDGKLRLLGISGSRNAQASYVFADPALVTGQIMIANPELIALSSNEYWILKGENETVVTLTWDELSSIEDISGGDLNRLTMVGWNGSDWEVIPTVINEFTLQSNSFNLFDEDRSTSFSAGSLSSTDSFSPDSYEIITFGTLSIPRVGLLDGAVSVFPNPARIGTPTFISYRLKGKQGKIEIYDGFSRLVYTASLDQQEGVVRFDQQNLVDDKYVITIIEHDGQKISRPLIMIK